MGQDKIQILYNGNDLFDGIGPTPFVSINVEPIRFGKNFIAKEIITLNGIITGDFCNDGNDYPVLIQKSDTLFSKLSQDFKQFEVKSDSGGFIKNFAKVSSFELEQDRTAVIKPYSITFEAFDEKLFFESFGVLDQSDEIQYTEEKNGQISITHSVSAVGFDTGSGGLQNAIDYVAARCVLGEEIISSRIIKNGTLDNPVLISIEEQFDRLQSSYSLIKKYTCDSKAPNIGCIFYFSMETAYEEQSGVYTVNLNGSIQGGVDKENGNLSTMDEIRTGFSTLDLYGLANSNFSKAHNINLNPNILNLKIEEKQTEISLSFSCSFDSDMGAGSAYMDAEYSIDYDDLTELHEVSASINIKGKKSQKSKWDEIKNFYASLDIRGLCQDALSEEGVGSQLEESPRSFSLSFDERNGAINVSASFVEINPESVWNDFKNLDFSLETNFSKEIILPIQTVYDGAKAIDIVAKTRPQISIRGSLNSKDQCSNSDMYSKVKDMAISMIRKYVKLGNFFIEDVNVTKDVGSGEAYSFDVTVSNKFDQRLLLKI